MTGSPVRVRGANGAEFTVDDSPWLREQVAAGHVTVLDTKKRPPSTRKPCRSEPPAKSAPPQSDPPDTD